MSCGYHSLNTDLPKEVILTALECCRDVYPNKDDFLVNRTHKDITILAVEGTNETSDWVTNLKFLIKRNDCHRGFANNANRTLAELVIGCEALDPKRKLVIAGHSLGGATATLIADLMWESNKNIALITAGSPRPGGRRLRRRVKDLEHLRFVHGNDIVPGTPPWIAGFVHTDKRIHLPDEVDTRFDGVADHNMGDYVTAARKWLG
jgi:predicted lipase|tara:strand:- start:845 stop:1462 length:618 start_codon:yes stop_codon:yes gene_type:complete